MLFKDRLKSLREDSDLTQEELAKILNLSRSAIASYEATDKEPSILTLIKIADFFNISLDYLLCRTNKRIPYHKIYKE